MRPSKLTHFWSAFLFILCCAHVASSQDYTPITFEKITPTSSFGKNIVELNKIQLRKIKATSNSTAIRKKLTQLYKELHSYTADLIEDGSIVRYHEIDKYIQKIVTEIVTENNIEQEIVIAISREPSLNAYCLPNGLLVVNLGLFYFLDNSDQLAAVIAHEISHNLLEHSLNTNKQRIEYHLSKNYKSQKRHIKNQQFGRRGMALELLRSDLYSTGRLRRKHEIEADSLGYKLIQKTHYESSEFLEALNAMALYDTIRPHGLLNEIYPKYFNIDSLPFDSTWLAYNTRNSDYTYHEVEEPFSEDSLSTHPEVRDRIDHLNHIYEPANDTNELRIDSTFELLKNIARLEQLPAFDWSEEYGVGLYMSLFRLQEQPDSPYYKKWFGHFLEKLRASRKAYTMNDHLDRPQSTDQSDSYQQYLHFIWNLDYADLAAFADYYNRQ